MIEKNCEICGKKFNTKYTSQKYCSIKCRFKRNITTYYSKVKANPALRKKFNERQRLWHKNNRASVNAKAKQYRLDHPERISQHSSVIARYLKHRKFIFDKFGNKNKGVNRFYQIEAYEQRLQEMDSIFIDQLPDSFPTQNLETIINYLQKKLEEQDNIFKEQSINIKGDKKWKTN